jgi:hypothetical protein
MHDVQLCGAVCPTAQRSAGDARRFFTEHLKGRHDEPPAGLNNLGQAEQPWTSRWPAGTAGPVDDCVLTHLISLLPLCLEQQALIQSLVKVHLGMKPRQ